MAGHVAGDATDDGSLDASFCLPGAGRDERNGDTGNREYGFHDTSPIFDPERQSPYRMSVPRFVSLETSKERACGTLRYFASMLPKGGDDGIGKA
jgi:hypothetical protein